jgi:3-oxoacyl-[acyl-carrier-protein] synthase III
MRTPSTYLRSVGVYLPAIVGLRTAIAQGRYPADEAEYLRLGGAAATIDVPAPELALRAAQHAFERSGGLSPADLDLVLYTDAWQQSPVSWQPRRYLQQHLTGGSVLAIELRHGCCGMFCALELAAAYLHPGSARRAALLVGADDQQEPEDDGDEWRLTAGDMLGHAGCALLITTDGGFAEVLSVTSTRHYEAEPLQETLLQLVRRTLSEAGITGSDVAKVAVPHGRRAGLPKGALASLGLTTADTTWEYGASIGHLGVCDQFVALDHLLATGALRSGDHVLLIGHGAGHTLSCAALSVLDIPSEYAGRKAGHGAVLPGRVSSSTQFRYAADPATIGTATISGSS